MFPTSFNECNTVLGAPKEQTSDFSPDETCCLSVLRTTTDGGTPVVVSCWKVTKEELEEINRTGRVWLVVVGKTMPPVSVDGKRPF